MSSLPAPENPIASTTMEEPQAIFQSKSSSLDIPQLEPYAKRRGVAFISSISKDEPITDVLLFLLKYTRKYNGDNGVGPLGFSMTLFQKWATAAGYDPLKG
ncbi:hypothetical protein D9757_000794 [Collybiopsis confluens]|uniref:Uncharacterized protein n=1 Tax=Collybiopsis confluens TaxID=2823264 RepID=A0A8H5I1K6_9AGAR|nr:hypothetical protein D9757_000794 [Collybiopsis confluens]